MAGREQEIIRKTGTARTAGFLLFLVLLCTLPSFADEIRCITIKAAAHPDFQRSDIWKVNLSRMVREVNPGFRKRWGISFDVKEFVYWDPGPDADSPVSLIKSLESNVGQGDCDLLLGYLPQDFKGMNSHGSAGYLEGCILLKDHPSWIGLAKVLCHELCHIFGAVDLDEKRSIMYCSFPGHTFDPYTSALIALNRNRLFNPDEFPLPLELRDKVADLYIARMNLHKAEPEIPVVLSYLFFEKIKSDSDWIESAPYEINSLHGWGQVYNHLGCICFEKRIFGQAKQSFLKSVQIDPNYAEARFNLGLALSREGREKEAVESYLAALRIRPEYIQPRINLSRHYLMRGEMESALEHARCAARIDPRSAEALTNLSAALVMKAQLLENLRPEFYGSISLSTKDLLDEAVRSSRLALGFTSRFPELYNILGIALALSNKIKGAEDAFLEAVRLLPNPEKAFFNLGILFLQTENTARAIPWFQRCLSANPHSSESRIILQRLKEAEELYTSSGKQSHLQSSLNFKIFD